MLYNEQKLLEMVEKKNAMHAALLHITKRQREARSHLQTLQGQEIGFRNRNRIESIPKELEIELREANAELERLKITYGQANQAFDEHGAIVKKCEDFLRDKGVKIPSPTVSVTGVRGTNFLGGAGT